MGFFHKRSSRSAAGVGSHLRAGTRAPAMTAQANNCDILFLARKKKKAIKLTKKLCTCRHHTGISSEGQKYPNDASGHCIFHPGISPFPCCGRGKHRMCVGRKAFGQIALFIHGPRLLIVIIITNPVGATLPIHARMCKRAICKLIAPHNMQHRQVVRVPAPRAFCARRLPDKRRLKCFLGRQWACSSVQLFHREAIPPTPGGEGLFCPCPAAVFCQENVGPCVQCNSFALLPLPAWEEAEYQQHMGLRGLQSFNKHYMLHNKPTIFWYLDQPSS